MSGKVVARSAPQPIDRHIGNRIRERRRKLHITQETLGTALGVTFRRIEEYEKGTRRIAAGQLQQIAHTLQCNVTWFFEGKDTSNDNRSTAA